MSVMKCVSFYAQSGWHCQKLSVPNGEALYISTPLTLGQGKPLDYFLFDRGSQYEITDDGIAMLELRACGFSLDDGRHWRGLRNVAQAHDFELEDDGAFSATFPKEQLPRWSDRILHLLSDLVQWERDRIQEKDQESIFTQEVAMLLRQKAPRRELETDVEVYINDSPVKFDFRWGTTYVDTVRPIAQSVNSKLRKALLFNNAELEGVDSLFIIDDRRDRDKAGDEMAILAQVASSIRFTDFQKHYQAE